MKNRSVLALFPLVQTNASKVLVVQTGPLDSVVELPCGGIVGEHPLGACNGLDRRYAVRSRGGEPRARKRASSPIVERWCRRAEDAGSVSRLLESVSQLNELGLGKG